MRATTRSCCLNTRTEFNGIDQVKARIEVKGGSPSDMPTYLDSLMGGINGRFKVKVKVKVKTDAA